MTKNGRDVRIKNVIEKQLGPKLYDLLEQDDVIELMVNPDEQVWIDRLGYGMEKVGYLSALKTETIIKNVAAYHDLEATMEKPIVEAEWPIDGSRFEGMIPPAVDGAAFALRKKAVKIFTLDNYIQQEIISEEQRTMIEQGIEQKRNILIVGATSSGKTTFANAVIDGISRLTPEDRLVIIEDTKEIQCQSKNKVQLHTSDFTTMQHLLKATLRLRPDRILVGEVRGGEALQLLKAWNTGHPGGLATIHANSAKAGLKRVEQMVSEVSSSSMGELVAEAVDYVFYLEKGKDGKRRLKEMIQVNSYDRKTKQYDVYPIV